MTPLEANGVYQFDAWGKGYFRINPEGNLCVYSPENKLSIDIMKVIENMKQSGMDVPVVVRFHDILRDRIRKMNDVFQSSIVENNYQGSFFGVYPIKVNQMREVVEEITDAGQAYQYGMEAGSKSELLAVLAYNNNRKSLTIINGYKDEEFIRMALLGIQLGHQIIIVIESLKELDLILDLSLKLGISPSLGLRAKMSAKGLGKWANSSGEQAKFGLSVGDLMNAVELLKKNNLFHTLKLLHFHMGSQISHIDTFQSALKEGTRVYVELVRMGAPLEFLDVGGGLAIDYDGSHSGNHSSKNYSLHEYATNVIQNIQDVCKFTQINEPNIICESGRYVTAHHSCIITNVLDVISSKHRLNYPSDRFNSPSILNDKMQRIVDAIDPKQTQESYHLLQQLKAEMLESFKVGLIGLEERAFLEDRYWKAIEKLHIFIQENPSHPLELEEFEHLRHHLYLCNFSVFQSAADSWAIDQLLPIAPIHRLNEKPTVPCTIADITCDSDGKIDRFTDTSGQCKKELLLHSFDPEKHYYLGIFLTGAYQDVMGDMHNLFGRLNEIHVYADSESKDHFYIEEFIPGSSKEQVLSTMQYEKSVMNEKIWKQLEAQISTGQLNRREAKNIINQYIRSLSEYTYLGD